MSHSYYTTCRAGLGGDLVIIAQDDPIAADRLLDLLKEKHKRVAENPHMGPARPDIAKELRYHPVGSDLLLYRPRQNIAAVRPGRWSFSS